jgi:hypothetical protein
MKTLQRISENSAYLPTHSTRIRRRKPKNDDLQKEKASDTPNDRKEFLVCLCHEIADINSPSDRRMCGHFIGKNSM